MKQALSLMLLVGLLVAAGCDNQGTAPNGPRKTPDTKNPTGTPGGPTSPTDSAPK